MKKHAFAGAVAALALAMTLGTGTAQAGEGIVVGPGELPTPARTALVAEIERARSGSPRAFDLLQELRDKVSEIDAQKRGRFAPLSAMIESIGPDVLLPVLEHLAIDAPPRAGLSESAWTAWRMGLLEAAGTLRDPRGASVYEAVLDGPETEPHVVRAAAEALGKLGTDAAAQKLVTLATQSGPKQSAVLSGMGHCRRTSVARALARALAAAPPPAAAERIIRSLGDVGSLWAWRTPIVAKSGEEGATRRVAAQALVDAFVEYTGEARQGASNALLVVAEPSTPQLITAAKQSATAETRAALDELAARFARNPIK